LRYRGFSLRLPPALRSVSRRCRRSDPKKKALLLSPLFSLSFRVYTFTLCARQVMTNTRDHRLDQSRCRLVKLSARPYQYLLLLFFR
jgi:hypothetical protein